jgi:hypothetical protein
MALTAQLDGNGLIVGTTASQTVIMPGGPVIDTGSGEQFITLWKRLLLQNEGSNVAYMNLLDSTSRVEAVVAATVNGAVTAVGLRSFVLEPGAIMEFKLERFYAYISLICDTGLLTNVRCSRMGGVN